MQRFIWLFLIITIFLISGCKKQEVNTFQSDLDDSNRLYCKKYYTVGTGFTKLFQLKAEVIASNVKNVVSTKVGVISFLNCKEGAKIKKGNLLAIIKPDFNDPNIKTLLLQRNFLIDQINNLNIIINSTKSNFKRQLQSLIVQKENLESQIKILNSNLEKLKKQKQYGIGDFNKQLQNLEKQLQNLKKEKNKLLLNKKQSLEKIITSINATKQSIRDLVGNVLLRIDEIFGITAINKHKNDAFENYLSAKNISLKEKIKGDFLRLNSQFRNFSYFSGEEVSKYIQNIIDLVQIVKQAIKDSVVAPTFPQSFIDNLYNQFYNYGNTLINLKSQYDSLLKTYNVTKNQYDNQIINLETQITTIKNDIKNIRSNKLKSYITNLDTQINQLKAQITSYKSNLKIIETNIENLKNQETTQIKNLENQLINLKNSLSNINIQLSPSYIYSDVNGKVKFKNISVRNKVGLNTLLCQIIPNKTSLKLQVVGNLPDNYSSGYIQFNIGNKFCKVKILSKLPYKDSVTQNNIYETDTKAICIEDNRRGSVITEDENDKAYQTIDLSDILEEGQVLDVKYVYKGDIIKKQNFSNEVFIPVSYVINKLTGQFVKMKTKDGKIVFKKVILGRVDGDMIQIISGLNIGDMICR